MQQITVKCEMARKEIDITASIERTKWSDKITYPCGQFNSFGKGAGNKYAPENIKNHVENCLACKTVLGYSEATVMNQSEVAACFCKGIDGKTTHKHNLDSEDGLLMHYHTIEAIRTNSNKIIRNTQCWAEGWASCPRMHQDYSLPLSTIDSFCSIEELKSINVLDVSDGNVLFTISKTSMKEIYNEDKLDYEKKQVTELEYYLFGHDEAHPYLVKLVGEPKTLKEAEDSMIPYEVKGAMKMTKNVKRQGDLYFIPISSKKLDILEIGNNEKHPNRDTFLYRALSHMKISNIEKQRYTFINKIKTEGYYSNSKITGMEIERKLYRPIIQTRNRNSSVMENTNHTATELGEIIHDGAKRIIAVRGTIKHANRQHANLELGRTWHIVVQNVVERTWNVPRRGSGNGGGD